MADCAQYYILHSIFTVSFSTNPQRGEEITMSRKAAAHCKPAIRSMRSSIALAATPLSLILLAHGCHSDDISTQGPTLVTRTKLDGNCFAKFAVSLPVFGPA